MGGSTRYQFFHEKLDQFDQASKSSASAGAGGSSDGGGGRRIDVYLKWFRELSFEDSICWAFEVSPVELDVVYWSHTLSEIKQYVNLKLGWWQTRASQEYQIMSIILSQAFGPASSSAEKSESPANLAEATQMLSGVFGKR
jgi:hypothetical protein